MKFALQNCDGLHDMDNACFFHTSFLSFVAVFFHLVRRALAGAESRSLKRPIALAGGATRARGGRGLGACLLSSGRSTSSSGHQNPLFLQFMTAA